MKNGIAITIDGRTVHWELSNQISIQFLQQLVQSLGPAQEGSGEDH